MEWLPESLDLPCNPSQIISNSGCTFFAEKSGEPEASLTLGWLAAPAIWCGEWSLTLKPRDQDQDKECRQLLLFFILAIDYTGIRYIHTLNISNQLKLGSAGPRAESNLVGFNIHFLLVPMA